MIPNLRDVGETINLISGREVIREKMLYRGGTVNELFGAHELPSLRSIVNLRVGPDQHFPEITAIHVPAPNTVENYFTKNPSVRNWANRVLGAMAKYEVFPTLIHCTAGKDRTGVIIALILFSTGVEKKTVIEEYLCSSNVKSEAIQTALDGIGDPGQYLYDSRIIPFLKSVLLL